MDKLKQPRITLRISEMQMKKILRLLSKGGYRSVSDVVRVAIEDKLVAEGLMTR